MNCEWVDIMCAPKEDSDSTEDDFRVYLPKYEQGTDPSEVCIPVPPMVNIFK